MKNTNQGKIICGLEYAMESVADVGFVL